MIRDLKVSRDLWRIWIINDIRDFISLLLVFYVILWREPSGRFVKTENLKGSVHATPEEFENGALFLQLGPSSTLSTWNNSELTKYDEVIW